MDESPKDNVSIQDILSHILPLCNDEELRNGFTKGYYISLIQRGLEELGYDTFYKLITEDIKFDPCFQLDVPCNMFNIREIYLFNGKCSPESSVQVYWKRLFNNGKGGTNYTAKRRDVGNAADDPYEPMSFVDSNVYYANIQNGRIMFSSNCSGFEWVRLIGNGAGTAIGDDPVIPRFFRTALCDYVCEIFFRKKMAEDRAFSVDQQMYYDRLYNVRNGSWGKAEKRVKRLGTWQRDTVQEVLGGAKDWGNASYW